MATITVGGGSPYTTIQQGIDAAAAAGDDSVVVTSGTYSENDVLTAADSGITISAASAGVTLNGTVSLSNAADVTLSGLNFTGLGSNTGVTALNSADVTITADSFTGYNEAIDLDGATGATVSNTTILNTTGSAIEAKNGADGSTVTNNVIDGVGAMETQGAIWLHGSNGSTISHNQITNTAGSAISLADFYAPGSTATQNDNDVIADNSLNDIDTKGTDTGAIYILGRSQNPNSGDIVQSNYIGATGSAGEHAVGIYLDDNASGVTVTQNVIAATPTMSDPWEIHGGSNNTLSGNIFDLGTGNTDFGLFQSDEADQQPQGMFVELHDDVVTGNIYVTESSAPHDPAFADLSGGIGNEKIQGNDFWAFTGAPLNVSGTLASGDTAPVYEAPAATPAKTLADYAGWSGDGIDFQPIDVSQIGTEAACYCAGTMILTVRGEVPVEALAVGALVVTTLGRGATLKPVRWLGHRRIDLRRHKQREQLRPIRVRAGALGAAAPHRDLLVSPGHRFRLEDGLVAASELVNNATIIEETPDTVEYWHVELDSHDVLLADGAEAETYHDTGNRAAFEPGDVTVLHPVLDGQAATPCLPYAEASPMLRERLALRAEALGWRRDRDPLPWLEINGTRIDPLQRKDRYRFALPQGCAEAMLRSRSDRPRDSSSAKDRRRLGLRLSRLALCGPDGLREVPLDHPLLAPGFYRVETETEGWVSRWTNGQALLPLAALAEGRALTALEVAIDQTLLYWVSPECDGFAAGPHLATALGR